MQIWMCALHCEAKPIIDFYRLKKASSSAFDCYLGENQICVVSGIGLVSMSAATAWASNLLKQEQTASWINLGIAGHAQLDIGRYVLASQVTLQDSQRAIYPVPLIRHEFELLPVSTLLQPSTEYREDCLFDMEAYGFAQTASRFSPLELCQCLKVISDNQQTSLNRDKQYISDLIAPNIPAITEYAEQLDRLAQQLPRKNSLPDQLNRFLALAHFTRSQQILLEKMLVALIPDPSSAEPLFDSVKGFASSDQIIHHLKQQLHDWSLHLSARDIE